MRKMLDKEFFDRPATAVAKDLLGKYLISPEGSHMITETEAYVGPQDKACHSYKGRTARTEPMYDEPGTIYIYFTYGMHYMLNFVTGAKDYPAAVLIRGVEGIVGPGRLTKALQIDKRFNHRPLRRITGLWVEDRGVIIRPREVLRTPRIGIDYAGEWKDKPYRFVLKKKDGRSRP